MGRELDHAFLRLGSSVLSERPQAIVDAVLPGRRSRATLARYGAALTAALDVDPLPCTTELYAEMFRVAAADDQWLAIHLIGCVERKGAAARRLWSIAAATVVPVERTCFKRCAVVESRHARMYVDLLEVLFPGALTADFGAQLRALAGRYSMRQQLLVEADGSGPGRLATLDVLVRLNLHAIRAAVCHSLRRAASRSRRGWRRGGGPAIVDTLQGNELARIEETGRLIERRGHGEDAAQLATAFARGLREVNAATSEEAIDFSYNQRFGNYP